MKDIFIARQPIFDRRQRVVGYELLYRSDGSSHAAERLSDEKMTSSVLVNGIVDIGLARLTGGLTAFVNVSHEMLFDGTVELLDPTQVHIELLESIEPTREVVARCRELVGQGYCLVLDDFTYDESYDPLLELVDVVKVDMKASNGPQSDTVSRVAPFGVRLLAEKVETLEVHERCVDDGFELFQGYHYFKPQTVQTQISAAQSLTVMRLMNMLQDPTASDRAIEEAFKSDPALTFKLLKIVNSSHTADGGVESIKHALRIVGRGALHRWLCLLFVSNGRGGGDVRVEISKAALIRGRMCEILGNVMRSTLASEIPPSGALFLVGLFAQVDQLVGTSLEEVLTEIEVAPEVRAALLDRSGHAGKILKSAEAYAAADFGGAEREITEVGGNPDILPGVYLDAVIWASERVLLNAS